MYCSVSGAPVARGKVAHLHNLGILAFNNLLRRRLNNLYILFSNGSTALVGLGMSIGDHTQTHHTR
jgi:hypothetical protein